MALTTATTSRQTGESLRHDKTANNTAYELIQSITPCVPVCMSRIAPQWFTLDADVTRLNVTQTATTSVCTFHRRLMDPVISPVRGLLYLFSVPGVGTKGATKATFSRQTLHIMCHCYLLDLRVWYKWSSVLDLILSSVWPALGNYTNVGRLRRQRTSIRKINGILRTLCCVSKIWDVF